MRSAVAAVALAVAACGVPTEQHATRVPQAGLPAEDGAQPQPLAPRAAAQHVFLVRDDILVARPRQLRTPTMRAALEALFTGPTQEEIDRGDRSAIPGTATVRRITVDEGTARLRVSDEFFELTTTEQVLAVGQVVFTATAFPGVEGVLFLDDGKPVEVTRPDGTVIRGAASRADFEALLRPGP